MCMTFNTSGQTNLRWDLEDLNTINGNNSAVIGSPVIIQTNNGNAIQFDGVDDAIQLNTNPLSGVKEFTIEVIFKPSSGGNLEQRFIHLEQDDENRVLVELRSENNKWWLDTFIKSGSSSKTLIDPSITHPSDIWYHAALVYKEGIMEHFVNGVKELTGEVKYVTVNSGKSSIGVRMNKVSWYKGAIKTLKVTNKALLANELIVSEVIALNLPASLRSNNNVESSGIKVFPVPAADKISVESDFAIDKNTEVNLWNLAGENVLLKNNEISLKSANKMEIKRQDIPSGIYYLSIKVNGKIFTKTLILGDN